MRTPAAAIGWLLRSAGLVLVILAAHSGIDPAWAHGIGGKDAAFVAATKEADIVPFMYLGGFKAIFGVQPNNKMAVAGFGLIHGFGLATKLQALRLNPNGLVPNMIGFNVGVEIGQIIALAIILAILLPWRRTVSFDRFAVTANALTLTAGFVLME